MSISGLPPIALSQPATSVARPEHVGQTARPAPETAPGFGARLGAAIDQVAQTQNNAAQAARDFETGRTDDIAAVMVEQQVASLGFQMTLSVRNKALSAYRDIMNMPV